MDTYRTWSEGSVLVIVGMTTGSDHLLHTGFTLILDDGHTMEPELIELIYKKLLESDIIEDPGHRDEQYLKDLIPEWLNDLEESLKDERAQAIEALLASLPTSNFN